MQYEYLGLTLQRRAQLVAHVCRRRISKDVAARETVRWVNYKSYYKDTEVLSGCLPVFKHGGSTGTIDELLGATCVELNVIVEIATLRNMDCWDCFWGQVEHGDLRDNQPDCGRDANAAVRPQRQLYLHLKMKLQLTDI